MGTDPFRCLGSSAAVRLSGALPAATGEAEISVALSEETTSGSGVAMIGHRPAGRAYSSGSPGMTGRHPDGHSVT